MIENDRVMIEKLKQDNVKLGLLLGLAGPVVGFFVYYCILFLPHHSFGEYLDVFRQNIYLIPKVMSLSLLANGLLFFLYTQYRKDLTAKGILVVTLVYALLILVLRLR